MNFDPYPKLGTSTPNIPKLYHLLNDHREINHLFSGNLPICQGHKHELATAAARSWLKETAACMTVTTKVVCTF